MENGKIPVDSLSQNFEGNFLNESRLNKEIITYPFGWEAPTSQEDGWLQIDLGSINQVPFLFFPERKLVKETELFINAPIAFFNHT